LFRESEVFIEDYAEIVSGVGRFDRAVVKVGWLFVESDEKELGF